MFGYLRNPLRRAVRGFSQNVPTESNQGNAAVKAVIAAVAVGVAFAGVSEVWERASAQNEKKKPRVVKLRESVGNVSTTRKIGGEWCLTDTNGKKLRYDDASLRGKIVMLYFGFGNCPDVCPASLGKIKHVLNQLDKKGLKKQVQVVFVSVDPLRDTPESLRAFLDQFDSSIIGVTGTLDELSSVANKFAAHFDRSTVEEAAAALARDQQRGIDDDDDKGESEYDPAYYVDHTQFIYCMDGKGDFFGILGSQHTPKQAADFVVRAVETHMAVR
ncbi:MAG: hypothetical protein MHM6MM_000980 [Cercozoa sp. M6MM]